MHKQTMTGACHTLWRRGYARAMVRSMTAAGAVPHFHYCDELDAGPLLAARALLAADPALDGARLTFLPFVLKVFPLEMQFSYLLWRWG